DFQVVRDSGDEFQDRAVGGKQRSGRGRGDGDGRARRRRRRDERGRLRVFARRLIRWRRCSWSENRATVLMLCGVVEDRGYDEERKHAAGHEANRAARLRELENQREENEDGYRRQRIEEQRRAYRRQPDRHDPEEQEGRAEN